MNKLIANLELLRKECENVDFYGDDLTKILIKKEGFSGEELSEKLFDEFDIEDERTNSVSTMILTGIGTSVKKLENLKRALKRLN